VASREWPACSGCTTTLGGRAGGSIEMDAGRSQAEQIVRGAADAPGVLHRGRLVSATGRIFAAIFFASGT
jgi:hypothetical protein